MAPVALLRAEGLHSSPKPLTAPAGALLDAINVSVRRSGIYETRRGFSIDGTFPDDVTTTAPGAYFGLAHFMQTDGTGYIPGWSGGAFGNIPATPRDNTLQRLNFVEAGNRLWYTDRQYTKALGFTGPFGQIGPAPSGLPMPSDPTLVSGGITTTPGWMANNTSVAYRYTYLTTAGGRIIESAPSNRVILTNTSGATRNTSVRIFRTAFPGGIIPTTVRLYRSDAVASGTTPSDELFLAVETPLAFDGFGRFDIADTQPEALLGLPLYTNPVTGDGILAANGLPPNGVDVELWDGRLWVANTRSPSTASATLIGVGAPNGLQPGDTITVNGVAYRAYPGGVSTSVDFDLVTSGTPAQNIEGTARNLVATVNNHNAFNSLPTVARYMSAGDDAPGIIAFEWQTADGTVGPNISVSRPTAWQITQQTTVDAKPHAIAFSKQDQPDAFPLTNFILVNTSAAPILRIHALRDRMFVFKTDGLYVVSGSFPYRVDMLDDTAILVSPDAIAQCNGVLYALTSQGAVAITDAGVRIVSLPIEQLIRKALADAGVGGDYLNLEPFKNFKAWGRATFAVGYETERRVQFWLEGLLGLTLNVMYDAWTIHLPPLASIETEPEVEPTSGAVVGTKLEWAMVEPATGRMWLWEARRSWSERKRLDRWDNGDEAVPGPLGFAWDVPLNDTTFSGLWEGAQPGDVLQIVIRPDESEPDAPTELIAAMRVVSATATTLTIDSPIANDVWDEAVAAPASDFTLSRPIPVFIRYAPITAGQPHLTKSFREVTFHFIDYSVEHADIIATTELVTAGPADAPQPVDGEKTLWTAERDGAEEPLLRDNKRRLIPREKQRGAQVLVGWRVNEAFASWELCGVSVEVDGVSERNSR